MKLIIWLEKSAYTHTEFARKLGIDKSTLSRYINGSRKMPLKIAVKIEKLTKGDVECKNLI